MVSARNHSDTLSYGHTWIVTSSSCSFGRSPRTYGERGRWSHRIGRQAVAVSLILHQLSICKRTHFELRREGWCAGKLQVWKVERCFFYDVRHTRIVCWGMREDEKNLCSNNDCWEFEDRGAYCVTLPKCICRIGQNHIFTVYIPYFWRGYQQIYGQIRPSSAIHNAWSNTRVGLVRTIYMHCIYMTVCMATSVL